MLHYCLVHVVPFKLLYASTHQFKCTQLRVVNLKTFLVNFLALYLLAFHLLFELFAVILQNLFLFECLWPEHTALFVLANLLDGSKQSLSAHLAYMQTKGNFLFALVQLAISEFVEEVVNEVCLDAPLVMDCILLNLLLRLVAALDQLQKLLKLNVLVLVQFAH